MNELNPEPSGPQWGPEAPIGCLQNMEALEDKARIDNTKVDVLYMVEGAMMLPAIVTRGLRLLVV